MPNYVNNPILSVFKDGLEGTFPITLSYLTVIIDRLALHGWLGITSVLHHWQSMWFRNCSCLIGVMRRRHHGFGGV